MFEFVIFELSFIFSFFFITLLWAKPNRARAHLCAPLLVETVWNWREHAACTQERARWWMCVRASKWSEQCRESRWVRCANKNKNKTKRNKNTANGPHHPRWFQTFSSHSALLSQLYVFLSCHLSFLLASTQVNACPRMQPSQSKFPASLTFDQCIWSIGYLRLL